jgi:hypothetical protein
MTLKEKIENILCNWIDKDYNREFVAKQIEIDSDDYAIDFKDWCEQNRAENILIRGNPNTQRLLEIFKKEKGL